MLELERKKDEDDLQTWENWGWMIINVTPNLVTVTLIGTSYKTTESELQNRLNTIMVRSETEK